MPEYILKRGSMQARFLLSRAKLQVIGGGFGNGKTTGAVQKALRLAQLYPGSNGLMARATYPKLNDTLRKEFIKWCPKSWIQSFPTSANASNTCTLKNGTTINFRYIQQQGKSGEESTTSNLLSATYDWVVIDQLEDPEIVEKDFNDILGRLRGNTPFSGDIYAKDELLGPLETLPMTGPRWFIVTLNPTRNWCYKKLIKPLKQYQATGYIHEDLFCVRDSAGKPILNADGTPKLLIELFEGSTYENKHVYEMLGATDFIETLESAYKGAMRDRFLLGKWAAYEGLIYDSYDEMIHAVDPRSIERYLEELRGLNVQPYWFEGYDYGSASPACYGLWFADQFGNCTLVDGFYKTNYLIEDQATHIKEIRRKWIGPNYESVQRSRADPDIFRRKQANLKENYTIADLFQQKDITWFKGDNSIDANIKKLQAYFLVRPQLMHPYFKCPGSPMIFHNSDLQWFNDEAINYRWAKDRDGNPIDQPVDKDDHAMDMTKYAMSGRPEATDLLIPTNKQVPAYMFWQEEPN